MLIGDEAGLVSALGERVEHFIVFGQILVALLASIFFSDRPHSLKIGFLVHASKVEINYN